ncbi:putative membrane protein [Diaminobutyricimonas aerilata]|uniref:Putative membrane protein n=1 Tax=Diaminobutyricimonas aerilata TaxID=1162967 RepID=A0A2M9CND0_9MICO|nr:PH domain-containing protein [Diaminobutyricimonas aerilata]PJJ73406.1 putative membrane protein [Diaminobutyricimonas aerilata]
MNDEHHPRDTAAEPVEATPPAADRIPVAEPVEATPPAASDGTPPVPAEHPAPGAPLQEPTPAPPVEATGLADGEWHRLHPATPLLKGGITFLAILGVVIANLRERLIEIFFEVPGGEYGGDPFDLILREDLIGIALLAVAGVLIVCLLAFYLSWRFHTFRITHEVVEVRSGILFRTNRKARLDRIQGINIARPLFARIFGAAKLEVSQAGQDANVQLTYLASGQTDDLRREILRLASGTQQVEARERRDAEGNIIERRVNEFLAPELDPDEAPPESVVKLHLGRLIGSLLLSEVLIFFLLFVAAAIALPFLLGEFWPVFAFVPAALGMGGYLVNRLLRSLRYSIALTRDGVRVGYGLLSTTNETLPPGRIHSVSISQSLLWRPAGWWEVKVNRASRSTSYNSSGGQSENQARSIILPVGDVDDVMRVIALLLPGIETDMLREGLVSKGGESDGFVNSPKRAAVLRWFSWRRNGYALIPDAVVLRRGAIWRELVVVPSPRMQSVAMTQGPLLRSLDLATVHVHTVAGPISARLGAVDRGSAERFFDDVARSAVESASSDTSHRWRSQETV